MANYGWFDSDSEQFFEKSSYQWFPSATIFICSITDGISLSDSSSAGLNIIASCSDSLILDDTTNELVSFVSTISDNFNVDDNISVNLSIISSTSDSFNLNDSVSGTMLVVESLSDSLTISDNISGAGKSVDNVWSETQLYSDNSLTCASTTTWDMETYQNTYLLLDQDTTLSGTVPSSNSGYYTCLVYNDGTYTLTLDSQFLTSAGEDLENTTTSGSYDLLGVYINNGLLFATMSTNFS